VKALCESSTAYEILVGSRDVAKGEEAIKTVKAEVPSTSSSLSVVQVDLESDESIAKAVETIEREFGRVDCLVNNGGAAFG
jgi:NADP-dependent 3-hydroxy acid dehydrogenase YdfG